jgi:hypothetical protein
MRRFRIIPEESGPIPLRDSTADGVLWEDGRVSIKQGGMTAAFVDLAAVEAFYHGQRFIWLDNKEKL